VYYVYYIQHNYTVHSTHPFGDVEASIIPSPDPVMFHAVLVSDTETVVTRFTLTLPYQEETVTILSFVQQLTLCVCSLDVTSVPTVNQGIYCYEFVIVLICRN